MGEWVSRWCEQPCLVACRRVLPEPLPRFDRQDLADSVIFIALLGIAGAVIGAYAFAVFALLDGKRTASGELRIPESADNVGLVGTASGSLIGMLIGVLGGPVGVLLGWGAGAMMGGSFDIDRAVTSDEALTVLGQAIPPESTAVIASVKEPAVEVIDGEMKNLDGEVTRRPVAEVMAAEEAAEAAAREARRTLHEKRKAELTASLDARIGKLNEKLDVS
jgi:uncharacterized membrane protein